MERYIPFFKEAEFYSIDRDIEKRAASSEFNKEFKKWKNAEAVKRALKDIFNHLGIFDFKIKPGSKSYMIISNITQDNLIEGLNKFNKFHNENFKITKKDRVSFIIENLKQEGK